MMLVRLLVLVELVFFCCPCRWPLMVASYFGRRFQIKLAVGPVQVEKCPCLMARRNVDVMGLQAVP